ncbi:hypothetical protein [Erythrobacter sp. BLCC-B19]|uniref:hypothetical protein n=1 Tax=Erythrobacter sp. BLCC-B19 TaxID=3025315 RepID=UPI002362B57A|nr:hypothetical protein [Erythrobacter sp. BLCC-B19]WDA42552.1 hypothetical protein PS060_07000 [Erythrobacter sp. BLCC-B19]
MVLFESPAMLGGIIVGVAMLAWTLGRWHSGVAASDAAARPAPKVEPSRPVPAPDSAAPEAARGVVVMCQQAARDERRIAAATARSLGEMHEEIAAYRRQERVLAAALSDGLLVELLPARARHECRYLGLIGQPTCPMSEAEVAAQNCATGCTATRRPEAYPSPAASALTRV